MFQFPCAWFQSHDIVFICVHVFFLPLQKIMQNVPTTAYNRRRKYQWRTRITKKKITDYLLQWKSDFVSYLLNPWNFWDYRHTLKRIINDFLSNILSIAGSWKKCYRNYYFRVNILSTYILLFSFPCCSFDARECDTFAYMDAYSFCLLNVILVDFETLKLV